MTRRLIWVAVVIAVIGGVSFVVYDRYFGSELRRGEELRDALAAELASAGIAFTSMEYDWRTRRVVAHDLVATELRKGVTTFTIGEVVYRGADPATIRAALANAANAEAEAAVEDNAEAEGEKKEVLQGLVEDLTLSNILVTFEGGAEFKLGQLSLKHLSLGQLIPRENNLTQQMSFTKLVLEVADIARRFHVRLLEAEDMRFWHPEAQATFEQELVRLEDYRGGNFSEFRLEGMSLVVAVAIRAKLDEYFVESVKARRFLDHLDQTSVFGLLSGLEGGEVPEQYASFADAGTITGDEALIGFELLFPGAGRIAVKEYAVSDRQFINGYQVGGKARLEALQLQFNMLTQLLTAGLDAVGVELSTVAYEAGTEAENWLVARAGNAITADGPVLAAARPDEAAEPPAEDSTAEDEADADAGESAAGTADVPADDSEAASEAEAEDGSAMPSSPSSKSEEQVPTGPADGKIEQGPAAPTPEVWGNEIEPPKDTPEPPMSNKAIAEAIRKLGFDNIHIDSESESAFDEETKVWEMSTYSFRMKRFWDLAMKLRFSGMGALEELGTVPIGAGGWWTGPKAEAVGKRFMAEGHFDGFTVTYRDRGFLPRLLALIADGNGISVEELVNRYVKEIFAADENGNAYFHAEGLSDAVKAFLLAPETFVLRLAPEAPVPFSAFADVDAEHAPSPDLVAQLGVELTFNDAMFRNFKKIQPNGSDKETEAD